MPHDGFSHPSCWDVARSPSESVLAPGLIPVISPVITDGVHFGNESLQPTLTANSSTVYPAFKDSIFCSPFSTYFSIKFKTS